MKYELIDLGGVSRMGRAEDLFKKIVEQGIEAIDELIENQKSEEFFLDFKRSSNAGSDTKLSDDDRENLARVISGFGNSEGGIVVWGIDCSKMLKEQIFLILSIRLSTQRDLRASLEGQFLVVLCQLTLKLKIIS